SLTDAPKRGASDPFDYLRSASTSGGREIPLLSREWLSRLGRSRISPFWETTLAPCFDHRCKLYDGSYNPGVLIYPKSFSRTSTESDTKSVSRWESTSPSPTMPTSRCVSPPTRCPGSRLSIREWPRCLLHRASTDRSSSTTVSRRRTSFVT